MDDDQDHRAALRGTARRVMDAAERSFARSGYLGASTRMIANEANANIGLIAYHFGCKEGLFEALIANRAHELIERINRSFDQNDPPAQNLHRFLVQTARYCGIENPLFLAICLRELLGTESSPISEIVVRHLAPHRDRFVAICQDGIQRGEIRPIDPLALYAIVMGALGTSVGLLGIAPGSGASGTRAMMDVLEVAVLSTPPEPQPPEEEVPNQPGAEPSGELRDTDPFGIGIFD